MALVKRLTKVKYKGIEAEFDLENLRKFAAHSSPELVKEVVLKLDAKIEACQDKTDDADGEEPDEGEDDK